MLHLYFEIRGGKSQVDYQKDYYIGLDCGTESVGFAVTDTEYNVLKFNGKSMWGTRLFDEAETAANRRGFRAARRSRERKKERIRLVQSLFAEEISKIDPLFFQRLNDSHYFPEDKTYTQPNSLFNDADFKDKDFFKLYPTIFHLRNALRKGETKKDPRLLYLAIHHIIKNRGHFLFTVGDDLKAVMDISSLLDDISDLSEAVYEGRRIVFIDKEATEQALIEKRISLRKEKLKEWISFENSKLTSLFINLMAGSKVSADKLFNTEEYKDLKIEFRKPSFEESDLPVLEDTLSDDEYRFVILFKAVYDWSLLVGIMAGYSSISEAKINQYNKNAEDLRLLKKAIKIHSPEQYEDFFHNSGIGSFSSYIGAVHNNGRKESVRRTPYDEFIKRIRKLIGPEPEDEESLEVLQRIENDEFLPLLISFRNSVLPYQVHKAEMDEILKAASADYPFLTEKDSDGLTVIDKLDAIIKFRIPYYVGPVGRNDKAVSGWAVRKKDGKILPWNWNDIIDEDASAEGFIRAMTNKCTYLPGEDVLPKNSLLYSRFMVLNELNNVRVNGVLLTVEQKQTIFRELFQSRRKVSINQLQKFMISEGWYTKDEDLQITGIDCDFKSSLGSYLDFKPFIDSKKLKVSEVEEIIKWLTLFSEGGRIAEKKIVAAFSDVLSKEEIKNISRRKYSGWGRLSEKFLTGIYSEDRRTGELKSIITLLWETQNNLMELLSSDYEFVDQIGDNTEIDVLDYSVVDNLAVSPSVKRQIWQTLRIVDEIEHIMKHPPKKIFLEVTRSKGDRNRTISRKDDLLFKLGNPGIELSDDEKAILDALKGTDSESISKRDKLYLYFTQLGKCMYSGKSIDLADIANTEAYDVDHIYPYSRSNDDSLTNRVLVLKTENSRKSDSFPIDDSVRNRMTPFWEHLKKMGLISPEKFKRLTRHSPLTEEDDKGFIARQLVETSQTAKASADILKRYFKNETKVVYSKAKNVSDFRQEFEFIKLRSLNNLHHAKDAYLNIVVGNVFDTKYTQDFIRNRKDRDIEYNLSKPYASNVPNAWIAGKNGTIQQVRKQMEKNDILYTKQCIEVCGGLFDQMPVAAGSKKGVQPIKASDPVLLKLIEKSGDPEKTIEEWTNKYGGYNNATTAYFALVKYKEKKGNAVSFIPISILDSKKIHNESDLIGFCRNKLHLNSPEILRERILKNTIISIDGYKFAITGKTGNQMTMESAIPLLLDDLMVQKIKRIERFLERKRNNKNLLIDTEHDGISYEGNIQIYDIFLEKAKNKLYSKRPSCQIKTLEKGKEKFEKLPLEDQCVIISNLMIYFGMGLGQCDLSMIGGSSKSGTLVHNSTFKEGGKTLKIFDSSVTGLYEKIEEIKV